MLIGFNDRSYQPSQTTLNKGVNNEHKHHTNHYPRHG